MHLPLEIFLDIGKPSGGAPFVFYQVKPEKGKETPKFAKSK